MEFIENNNYTERVYYVDINKDKLKELLNKIIKELNYKVYGEYILSNDLEVDFKNKKIISGACLPNGDDLFVNIKDIYKFTSSGQYSYHNDSIGIIGEKVIVPELVNIIQDILLEKDGSIEGLLNYKDNDDIMHIDLRIENLNYFINTISNFDFTNKIQAINDLKKLCEYKEKGYYFNTTLLQNYYMQVLNCIELNLTSEKFLNKNNKVFLKDLLKKSTPE